jgi:hypothetical protein
MQEVTYNRYENSHGQEVDNNVSGVAILSLREIWIVTPKRDDDGLDGSSNIFNKVCLEIKGAEIN